MRSPFSVNALCGGIALAVTGAPLAAQDEVVRKRDVDVEDVAMSPLNDLNLLKGEIPAALQRAVADTYDSQGLTDCAKVGAELHALDRVLGPDLDLQADERDRLSVTRIAKSAIGSFIPFRGILRELSGAADKERALEDAIYAGAVRRGFLKGIGQTMGCAYPVRPAYTKVEWAENAPPQPAPAPVERTGTVTFINEEVAQATPTGGN